MIREKDMNYSVYYILKGIIDKSDIEDLNTLLECDNSFGNSLDSTLTDRLSFAQRVLLFIYGTIYIKIRYPADSGDERMKWLSEQLEIVPIVLKYVFIALNEKRLDFIKRETEQKSLLGYLFNTDPAIAKFAMDMVYVALQQMENAELNLEKIVLTGLQSKQYEHLEDRELLEALKKNKSIEVALKYVVEYQFERIWTIRYLGSAIEVTKRNMPYIYEALLTVCKILDVNEIPRLYVQQGFINACTVGAKNPVIVLDAGCLSLLTYGELLFILGHEVGHVKSLHQMYHLLAHALPYITDALASVTLGLGGIVGTGVQIPVYRWFRKSELTADRAGLLACQNIDDAISALMKVAGYPPKFYSTIDKCHFKDQYDSFEELNENSYNKMVNYLSIAFVSHPWSVVRAAELEDWVKSNEYEGILSGMGRAQNLSVTIRGSLVKRIIARTADNLFRKMACFALIADHIIENYSTVMEI